MGVPSLMALGLGISSPDTSLPFLLWSRSTREGLADFRRFSEIRAYAPHLVGTSSGDLQKQPRSFLCPGLFLL